MSAKSGNEAVMNDPSTIVDKSDSPHQLIYADQMASIAFGPFVSRVTLSVENHNSRTRDPVVTLVIPTVALHQLANQILFSLADKKNNVELLKQYEVFANILKG
jgi:hypothetical protein